MTPSTVLQSGDLGWVLERDGYICLYGFVMGDPDQFGLDPHHIIYRSQGGQDTPENLITLCRKHHDQVHQGKITAEQLKQILKELYAY